MQRVPHENIGETRGFSKLWSIMIIDLEITKAKSPLGSPSGIHHGNNFEFKWIEPGIGSAEH